MRSERCIIEFMANSDWIERLLQIAEEFEDEEAAITILRTLKLVFKSEPAFDRICDKYPSMGEFLCQMILIEGGTAGIVSEGLVTLEILLRRPHYIKLIGSPS